MLYINFPENRDGSSIVAHLYRARICKRLESPPRIDSKESIRPADVACRAGTSNRVVVAARQAENRFLGPTGTAGVVDTVGKFDTGVKKLEQYQTAYTLKGT